MSEMTESVTIDPVEMNITNRVSSGCVSKGQISANSGILIQGEHHGSLTVKNGPLVIAEGGHLSGEITVEGDAYVFGTIGSTDPVQESTKMTVMGTLYLTSKSISHGNLSCGKLALYHGARVHGALDTIDASASE